MDIYFIPQSIPNNNGLGGGIYSQCRPDGRPAGSISLSFFLVLVTGLTSAALCQQQMIISTQSSLLGLACTCNNGLQPGRK